MLAEGVFFPTDRDEDIVFVRKFTDGVDLSERVGQRRFTGGIDCELLIFFGVNGSGIFFEEDIVFVRKFTDGVDLSERVGQRRFTGGFDCELLIFFGVNGSGTFFVDCELLILLNESSTFLVELPLIFVEGDLSDASVSLSDITPDHFFCKSNFSEGFLVRPETLRFIISVVGDVVWGSEL